MFSADPRIWILAAAMILTIPLNWLCAALAAAAFHELCHMGMLRMCGGHIHRIHIGLGGTVMDADGLDPGRELLCALAGPAGSLSLLLLCRHFPRLALAGGIQGLYNLLPVYPLDGGRALHCFLRITFPEKGEILEKWIEYSVYAGLFCLSLHYSIRFSLGLYPALITLACFSKLISRKSPCKQRRIRVQ